MLIAVALRLWRIDSLPPGFHFDESFEGLEAWRILTDPSYRPIFLSGQLWRDAAQCLCQCAHVRPISAVWGEAGPLAMRTTAAACSAWRASWQSMLLATELRRLDPRRLTAAFPLLAAAVLATLRWHMHFSRMGIEPIFVPLLWAAATWLLLRGWRCRRWVGFAGCGLMLALAMYAYQGAWIIPFLMLPVVGLLWLAPPPGSRPASPAAAHLAAAVCLAAGPAACLVLCQQPGPAAAAPHADRRRLATTLPQLPHPWQNALASALMFVPLGQTGDLDPRRNLPGVAALNWWQFVPFAAGMALALWRVRNPAYSMLLVGLAGLLLPGVFSEYAPHFHRVLGAAAPAALLCGLGLDALVRWGLVQSQPSVRHRAAGGRRGSAGALAVALVLGGAVTAARDYFVRWAALPDLFYAFDTGLWQIGEELARQPTNCRHLSHAAPADHPTWPLRPPQPGPGAHTQPDQL